MRKELLDRIEKLGERLPPNTLDQLIDDLGGPEDVAEVFMTYECLILCLYFSRVLKFLT